MALSVTSPLQTNNVAFGVTIDIGRHGHRMHRLFPSGRSSEAMTELKENLARHPNDRDTLLALISSDENAEKAIAAAARGRNQNSVLAALIGWYVLVR